MIMTCEQCRERFDSNDVVIDRGEMACPRCAAVIDLDDVIKARAAGRADTSAHLSLVESNAAPSWMHVSEGEDALEVRWRMSARGSKVMWVLSLLALGLLAGIIWLLVAAFTARGDWFDKVMPLAVLAPIDLVLGCLALGMWLNSTVVSANAGTVSVRIGPIPLYTPFVQVETARIAYFWSKAGEAKHDDSVHPLWCATTEGELLRLVDIVPDRAGAHFLKERLSRHLLEKCAHGGPGH